MKCIRGVVLVVALTGALAAVGYLAYARLLSAPAAPQEPAPDPASGQAPTGRPPDSGDTLESKPLVTDEAIRESRKKRRYIHDPRIPGGVLRGVCYVKHDRRVRLYPPFPVELAGDNAIKDPRKGELEYFESRKPLPLVYLGRYAQQQKRYGVKGAVIMLRDVEAGRLPNFDRIRYQVDYRTQQIVPAKPQGMDQSTTVFNPSAYGVGVMGVKQLTQALNLTLHDCHLVLTDIATGKTVWEDTVSKYHDPNFPGDHLGSNPSMGRPAACQIQRIEKKGIYKLSCTRHPWQHAYMVVWDSPYLTVSTGDSDYLHRHPQLAGEFAISGIPEGKHTVEVWHPRFVPLKKTHEIEISMDETTPLTVEFEVPSVLKAKPKPLPDTPITEWAFVGPFDPLMDEEPDAPNNNLDFAATYEGMEEQVAWKRIKAPRGEVSLAGVIGKLDDLCLAYYAVQIDSPKAQRLHLQINVQADELKMWLDRKVIFTSYTGDFGTYRGRLKDWFIITGDLKAGKNTLLVLISAEHTERASFSARYHAEGAGVKVPGQVPASHRPEK